MSYKLASVYLKPKLIENLIKFPIRFQLWGNFMPCVAFNLLIFVPKNKKCTIITLILSFCTKD